MRKLLIILMLMPLFAGCGVAKYNGETVKISTRRNGQVVDLWAILQSHPQATIVLESDVIIADAPSDDIKFQSFRIDGRGHTMRVGKLPILRNTDVWMKDIVVDCKAADKRVIYAIGGDEKCRFEVSGCFFQSVGEVTALCARKYGNVSIENCEVQGKLTEGSRRQEESTAQILIYECYGRIMIRGNKIQNCFGCGIDGIGFKPDEQSEVMVAYNEIDHVSNGGIVFTGGEVWNAVVRGNRISNTHCLGKKTNKESNGGSNSVINFHGFRNAVVEDNIIRDCPNSSCFDFDGSVSGAKVVAKGTRLKVTGNRCFRVGGVALFVVKDVEFTDNVMSNVADNTEKYFVMIDGASNVKLEGNSFNLMKGEVKSFYPLYLSDIGDVDSGKIRIARNKIDTDGHIFVFVNQHFDGECEVGENDVISSEKPLMVVNNSKKDRVRIPQSNDIVWYK